MKKLSVDELNRISIDDFKFTKKIPVVIVLDNVRSMHNVGSIFRLADAFLVDKIYLCGITATPPNREISKTAIGADKSVDWVYCNNVIDSLNSLKQAGYTILGFEHTNMSIRLDRFEFIDKNKYCMIFGNEMFGILDVVLDKVDNFVEIPQYGTKHSLNVSVAAGIALWDICLKMNLLN